MQTKDAELLFAEHLVDATPNGGEDCCTDILALGDINGDGYLDLVLGAERASKFSLSWYEYPTWEEHSIAFGQYSTDAKVADMDGDGDVDIVVSELHRGVLWLENSNRFGGTWVSHRISSGHAHDIEVGDLDGDGRADVVTADKHRVDIWRQVMPGRWAGRRVADREGEGLALLDIDGDGDLDVFFSNVWLESPADVVDGAWVIHEYAPSFDRYAKVAVADVDADGIQDVVLSVAEGAGEVMWFDSSSAPLVTPWRANRVTDSKLEGAHSLAAFDADLDGDVDILVAEMHTSRMRRILLMRQEQGAWHPVILGRQGSHNMQAADIDRDGDVDFAGKNYGGRGRRVELWEGRAADLALVPKEAKEFSRRPIWRYRAIDTSRQAGETFKTGLDLADVDRDGYADVLAGGSIYLNPSGNLHGTWRKVIVDADADLFAAVPEQGLSPPMLIGVRGVDLVRYRAVAQDGTAWEQHSSAEVGPGRLQGYFGTDLSGSAASQLVFTKGRQLYFLETLATDIDIGVIRRAKYPMEEAGISVGDIDRDGLSDVVAIDETGHRVCWLRQAGGALADAKFCVAASLRWIDRVAAADINQDGRLDIVFSEETQDLDYNARVIWIEAPENPRVGGWVPRTIVTVRSANSLSVADMDGDGVPDIVLAEHTDMSRITRADNLTLILHNESMGKVWRSEVVENGPHSSHIGARAADLDGDGDLEILSIGWEQSCCIHMWVREER